MKQAKATMVLAARFSPIEEEMAKAMPLFEATATAKKAGTEAEYIREKQAAWRAGAATWPYVSRLDELAVALSGTVADKGAMTRTEAFRPGKLPIAVQFAKWFDGCLGQLRDGDDMNVFGFGVRDILKHLGLSLAASEAEVILLPDYWLGAATYYDIESLITPAECKLPLDYILSRWKDSSDATKQFDEFIADKRCPVASELTVASHILVRLGLL